MTLSNIDFTKVMIKVTYIGLLMNVIAPISIFAAVVFLLGKNLDSGTGMNLSGDSTVQIMFYALLVITAFGIIVTFLIRKNLPEKALRARGANAFERFENAAVKFSIIIFAFNLSYAIYGLVLILIGAELQVMMLFMAFSLITYQIFRPRQKFLERFQKRVEEVNLNP